METVLDVEMELMGGVEKNIVFGEIGNSANFEVLLSNSGNVESEFRVFSSGGLRGWNVILSSESRSICENNGDHLLCTLDEGESVMIYAKVNPPSGDNTEVEDSFTFTLSTEPSDIGLVGRENLELTVNGQPEEFAFNSLITPNVLMSMAALVLIGFAYLALRRRN